MQTFKKNCDDAIQVQMKLLKVIHLKNIAVDLLFPKR